MPRLRQKNQVWDIGDIKGRWPVMDGNTAFVLVIVALGSIVWLPILLSGIERIIRAWRGKHD